MAGQIISRGDRTWLVRIYLGVDPQTKRRTYHGKTIHGTKKDAQHYLNAALRERDLGTFAGPAATLVGALLDDLLLDYQTNGKSYGWASLVVRVHLRPFFGAMKAAKVGTDQIRAYIASRQKPDTRHYGEQGERKREYGPAANGTINRELTLLRRALNLGRLATPPKVATVPNIPILAEGNVRKGFFEHDAFLAVRQFLPEEIRPVVTFAYCTGCRKGEILGLHWSQVDLADRSIRLHAGETKNGDGRTVPMAPDLYEVLKIQKQIRDQHFPDSPWVFSRIGVRILDFRGAWESACRSAGLVNAAGECAQLFHDLRRTGVRNLVRAGVPERVAMMISGHKTRAVFDRYNIVSDGDLKEAGRRLGEYLANKSAPEPAEDGPHTTGTQNAKEAIH